jgi:hypothetical protein
MDTLSDDQRDKILNTALEDDAVSADFAESIGASHRGVLEHWRNLGAIDSDEVEADLKAAKIEAATESNEAAPSHREEPIGVPVPETPAAQPESAPEVAAAEQPEPAGAGERPPSEPPSAIAASFNPFNPNGKRGRREWTPEQRAAQSERARAMQLSKPPLVPDDAFESVRADWEAGTSFDAIGRKYGCSGGHIRNFLKKHGVDPRRTKADLPAYQAIPREEYEWKEEDKQRVIQMRSEGIGWRQIGEVMGRTGSSCSAMYHHYLDNHPEIEAKTQTKEEFNAAVSAGLTEAWAKKARKITEDDIETVREMVAAGTSMNAIGDHFSCGHQSVIHFCKKHGIRRDTNAQAAGFRGKAPERDGAKIQTQAITTDDIAEVQEMLDKDDSYETIGEWFGCDAEAVRAFCTTHRLVPTHLAEKAKRKYAERLAMLAANDSEADHDEGTGEVEHVGAKLESRGEPFAEVPVERLISEHNGYAGKRDPQPNPLLDSDWPDIRAMVDRGRGISAIAGDYDVSVPDLERFIAAQRIQESGPPLGKPHAPNEPLAVGAN